MTAFKRLSTAGILIAVPAALLFSHGLIVNTDLHPPTVVVSSSYDGGGIPAFAAATVFGPDASESPYQSGRADASGRFAFLPDRAGEWTVIIDDEMGHRRRAAITIDADFLAGKETAAAKPEIAVEQPEPPAGLSNALKLLIGLCLIFGFTGLFMGLKARRDLRSGKAPHK
jgi:nickel transport protein